MCCGEITLAQWSQSGGQVGWMWTQRASGLDVVIQLHGPVRNKAREHGTAVAKDSPHVCLNSTVHEVLTHYPFHLHYVLHCWGRLA